MNRKGTNENISVTNRNMVFFSPCTHNYVKITASKEIYAKLNRERTKSKVREPYNTMRRRLISSLLPWSHRDIALREVVHGCFSAL